MALEFAQMFREHIWQSGMDCKSNITNLHTDQDQSKISNTDTQSTKVKLLEKLLEQEPSNPEMGWKVLGKSIAGTKPL